MTKAFDLVTRVGKQVFAKTVERSFMHIGTHMGGKQPQMLKIESNPTKYLKIMEATSTKAKEAPTIVRGQCDVEKVFLPLEIAGQIGKMLRRSKSSYWKDPAYAFTYSDGNVDPHFSEADRLSFARTEAEGEGFVMPTQVSDANLAGCFALTMQQGLINYNVANIFSNSPEKAYLQSALGNAEGVGDGYYDLLARTRGWMPFNSLSNVFGGFAGAVHIVQDNTATGVKEYKRLVKDKLREGKTLEIARDEAFTQIAQGYAVTEACVDNAGFVTLRVAESVPQFGNCIGSLLNYLTFDKDVFQEVFKHRDNSLIEAVEKAGLKIEINGKPVDISFAKGEGKKVFGSGKDSVKSELALADKQLKDTSELLATKIEEVLE